MKVGSFLYLLRKQVNIALSIIFSFNRTAYHVVWIKFLKLIATPFDLLLSKAEKKIPDTSNPHPVLFVVGMQRTGSTIVSQTLAKALSVTQIGNFNSIFWRSRSTVHKWMSRYKSKTNSIPSYTSYYGISRGLFTVGDCYEVYDQWMGKNHYNIPPDIDKNKWEDMKNYFDCLSQSYNLPILSKNNRNTLAIKELSKAFPNAYFIYVHRDLTKVVKSTILASNDFFGKAKILWGLYPQTSKFNPDNYKNIEELTINQCHYLDLEIEAQLKELDTKRYIKVNYDEFCRNPLLFVKRVEQDLNQLGYSIEIDFSKVETSFKSSNRLNDAQKDQRIRKQLAALKTVK